MANLNEIFTNLESNYQTLSQQQTTGNCWQFSTTMQDLGEALREHIQDSTKEEIRLIVTKLKSNLVLNAQDLQYVKLWICGDAEYYSNLENNYGDWAKELERLMTEIKRIKSENPDFITSSTLRAMFTDGIRVIGNMMFYLKEKERVHNFIQSTKEIDIEERALLIRLLEAKIHSSSV